MAKKNQKPNSPVLATNRRAKHDYEVIERIEAGIELVGSEVKSLRDGRVHFGDAFVSFDGGQAWLIGLHIDEYGPANRFNHEPLRKRRLLLHRREIEVLGGRVTRDGLTVVPMDIHLKGRMIKVGLVLARGKKAHDKRESIKKKLDKREMREA